MHIVKYKEIKMKKFLIAAAFMVAASTSVMAQSVPDLLVGGNVGYGRVIVTESNNDITRSQPMFSLGGFLDATYLRLSADYSATLGNSDYEVGDYSTSGDSYKTTNMNFSVLGKLPIDVGAIKIWGGVGIMYSWNLTEEVDGNDVGSHSDIDDFYLLGAFGADIAITDAVFICPAATVGYNLTPNPTDPEVSGDWDGYMLTLSIGVGFKI